MGSRRWSHRTVLMAGCLLVAACSRGPSPPRPTEDLRPTIVGAIAADSEVLPVTLEDGTVFPPDGATARRIRNWPTEVPNEPDWFRASGLLLAGQDPGGSWWYEITWPGGDPCWDIQGGSFDLMDTIWFSSGLRVPKAPDFELQDAWDVDPSSVFPGHQSDVVCVDEQGVARSFRLFRGR